LLHVPDADERDHETGDLLALRVLRRLCGRLLHDRRARDEGPLAGADPVRPRRGRRRRAVARYLRRTRARPRVKRKSGFAPIGAYAAIGDGRTVALVAADGSIDFLSLPDIHCPTTFGALLDPESGGRYVDGTNVLVTTYSTKDGAVRVTEALTLQDGGLVPWTEVARRVEGLAGE